MYDMTILTQLKSDWPLRSFFLQRTFYMPGFRLLYHGEVDWEALSECTAYPSSIRIFSVPCKSCRLQLLKECWFDWDWQLTENLF